MSGKKEISFEQALAELQSVIDDLEQGKTTLEKSLSLYERGMELVKLCNDRLDDAEKRVSIVTAGENGITTEPFAAEDTL